MFCNVTYVSDKVGIFIFMVGSERCEEVLWVQRDWQPSGDRDTLLVSIDLYLPF